MPLTNCRLEIERQKREKYLQRKVQETLCLRPPEQPSEKATTLEEQRKAACQYQNKLRMNRILQVRAQEMLFASQRVAEFRDRKCKDSKMLLNHLKEVWRKDQRRRIASLEEEFANACRSIGLSHDAALLVEKNRAAKEELQARQEAEGRCWDTLRFEEAMHKQRERKDLREKGDSASALRRKIVESVSSIERSFARRYNRGPKPKLQEKHVFGCFQTVYPPVSHDVSKEKMYSRLAGFPSDFKDTYLHSRFDILQDRTNRPSSAVVNCPEQEAVDAWNAADAQRESNRCERARQIELERLYNERNIERGTAAAAKLLNDKRIAMLEQEVDEAFREEEREKGRIHAVTGVCPRITSGGQERRTVYTKHKISNPLSCPGLHHTSLTCSRCRSHVELTPTPPKPVKKEPTPELNIECEPDGETGTLNISVCPRKSKRASICVSDCIAFLKCCLRSSVTTESPENQQETLQHQIETANTEKKSEALEDHPAVYAEKHRDQSPSKTEIQGKRIELADRVSYQLQQGAVLQTEVESELSGKSASNRKIPTEVEINPHQQQSATDGADLILEPGVANSPQHFSAQTKRKGISPIRGSWEHAELNTAGAEEGHVMKLLRVKSPHRSSMMKNEPEDANGNERSSKGQLDSLDRDEEDIEGSPRRAKEERRENGSWVKDLFQNASPGKNRYHMQSVREAVKVEKEVEFYNPVFHHNRATHSSVQCTESGETQRSQRESSKVTRPPFISSGMVGYKKVLTEPLMPQSSRRASESEWSKVASNEERASQVQEDFKALSNAPRGSNLDTVKENVEADVHESPLKERHRPLSGPHASSWSGINKNGVETSRRWAHPVRPRSALLNPHEQRKMLKTVNGAKWATREDQSNDEHGLCKDAASKGVETDTGSSKNRNQNIRSESSTWNGVAGICPSELIHEIGESREDNSRKGDGSEHQERRVQEPKLRQKAVWKSYIDEKKLANKKKPETPTGNRLIKSEPSSPPVRIKGIINSRPRSAIDQPDDYQLESRPEQRTAHPIVRNCTTPGGSVKIRSNQKSRFVRDTSVPRSWKYPQASSKEIEVEALENISSKIQSLSKRFQSPAKPVSSEASPLRRSRKDQNSKEIVALHSNGNLAEREGSAMKDAGSNSASNVADTLINAWKTGKFQEDYVKAMKRAKEITKGSNSQGLFKIYSGRNYNKPRLIMSPFRSTPDREMADASQDNHGENQRSSSANPRINHKSLVTRSRKKPWMASSPSRRSPDRILENASQDMQGLNQRIGSSNPRTTKKSLMMRSHSNPCRSNSAATRSTDRMMNDRDTQEQNHRSGSANPSITSKSPMTRSNTATMLSPKSLWGPEIRKNSAVKSCASGGRKESSEDPWEAQSLDFVLGSLAEQVRELDERLRSATASSPALSSSSSLSREFYVNRDKQTVNHPTFETSLPERLLKDLSSSSSVASSPERRVEEFKHDPPAARNISRGYARGHKDAVCPHIPYTPAGGPASTGMYMDNLTPFLTEISSGNPSAIKRSYGTSSYVTSRACSVASQRDPLETRVVLVVKGKAPAPGNDTISKAINKGQLDHGFIHDRFYANGSKRLKGKSERASDRVTNRVYEVRDREQTKTYEKRNVSQEKGFGEGNGIRRVLAKRLGQSRWTQQQAAENGRVGVQDELEKRTVEVRGCAPQQVIHGGHALAREQLVKEVVENGLPSPELNDHGRLKKGVVMPGRERNMLNDGNGRGTPVKLKRSTQGFSDPQQVLSNGKPATNGIAERGAVQLRGHPSHAARNEHTMTNGNLQRKFLQRMVDQAKGYPFSNAGEELRNTQPESPVWEEGSSHSPGSWRKKGIDLDEIDDRMLLSGSVDFSPWNTERLPDIGNPQSPVEDKNRSKSTSPIPEEEIGNVATLPKNQRPKPSPKLSKTFGQKPLRKTALLTGEYYSSPNATPVRESASANSNSSKRRVRQKFKRAESAPRGVDALWSLEQGATLKTSTAQNGFSLRRKNSAREKNSPERNQRRMASVPKCRLVVKEQTQGDNVLNSTSKTSQDHDNYLPIIMAKDPESRQKVIERRRKALQLDMEHRQRLRKSRPSSARSSEENGFVSYQ